jgi:hypothetical protein
LKMVEIEPIKYKILWYYRILEVSRIPTVYHVLNLDAGIKRYELNKIQLKSDLNFYFEIRLNQRSTCVAT